MKYSLRIITLFVTLILIFNSESVAQSNNTISSNLILQTTTSWDGNPIVYPDGEAEITALRIDIPSGTETGWHFHPVPSFAYVMEGSLELIMEDGSTLLINKGEALAEVTNTVHSGKSVGESTLKLIVFYAGAIDKELTIMSSDD